MSRFLMSAMVFFMLFVGNAMAQDPLPPPNPNPPNPQVDLVITSSACEGAATSKTMATAYAMEHWLDKMRDKICELEALHGGTWEYVPDSFSILSLEYDTFLDEDGNVQWICYLNMGYTLRRQ